MVVAVNLQLRNIVVIDKSPGSNGSDSRARSPWRYLHIRVRTDGLLMRRCRDTYPPNSQRRSVLTSGLLTHPSPMGLGTRLVDRAIQSDLLHVPLPVSCCTSANTFVRLSFASPCASASSVAWANASGRRQKSRAGPKGNASV